ncbi:hypothetical protein SMD20_34095 [Nonomuraea sp. LP-02]|uniref:hypothetical protein n=1 Tax=Nonomuraea sp. LP-02 TaxID=3097960 RepID=UPI002E2EC208|nr:hypothetical protein [Nonomuraea sp. LP-02]MED7929320.1 hypothetical protein [Nonomuraea sp. LP-02]
MAKTTAPAKPAKKTVEPTPCLCGCGENSKGKFRPGHDARMCSQLAKRVEARELTRAKALAEAGKASEALKNKLATMLDNQAKRFKERGDRAVARAQAKAARAAARSGDEKVSA